MATSAAAASATAQRAKDHEERSAAMYSQTEELMKFQFMSMSLSYFSSLNMLKTMRDINADTTTAAVTSSADAAAAAAASAAAANLPGMKAGKVLGSVSDVVGQEVRKERGQVLLFGGNGEGLRPPMPLLLMQGVQKSPELIKKPQNDSRDPNHAHAFTRDAHEGAAIRR